MTAAQPDPLTLATALAEGRLDDFVAQAEAGGVGPADRAQFDAVVGAVTASQLTNQTSHSPAADGSRGK